MGKIMLIEGESGSGKTCSLRNFNKEDVAIFNTSGKPLPFKKEMAVANNVGYATIKQKLRENSRNCYVLDDIGLAMTFYLFDHVMETGYGKFTQAAKDFYDLVQCAIRETSDDTTIYFIMHVERSEDGSKIKAKTAGKMIDNQLTLESLFSIVLMCVTDGKRHYFVTQSDGVTTAKSPMDMFPLEIDNDLAEVDMTIREYYGMAPINKVEKKEKAAKVATTTDKVPEVGK